jgi:hypothetical protein
MNYKDLTFNPKDFYKNSYAIIIGIGSYSEEIPLSNAYNDASAIQNVLEKDYNFTILKSLFNENATASNIREIFSDLIQNDESVTSKDRLIIYYSGHGKLRISYNYNGQEIKKGYLVPYDSKKNKFHSNIPMEELIEGCQNCKAKHILIILDCCYSGYAAMRSIVDRKYPKELESYITDITKRRSIQLIAAGQEDEPVSDSGIRPGYSAFTGALLGILESKIDPDNNGILTASEIGINLEKEILTQRGSRYQRPLYSHIAGSAGGDLLLDVFDTNDNGDKNNDSYYTKQIKKITKGYNKINIKKFEYSINYKLKIIIPLIIISTVGIFLAIPYIDPFIKKLFDEPPKITTSNELVGIDYRSYIPLKSGETAQSGNLENFTDGYMWNVMRYPDKGELINIDTKTGNVIYKANPNYRGVDDILLVKTTEDENIAAGVLCFLIDIPPNQRSEYTSNCAYQFSPKVNLTTLQK